MFDEERKYRSLRARDLKVGDVMYFSTKRCRTIAEIQYGITESQFYPHKPYKVVRVRYRGDTEFTWQRSPSSWACIVLKPEPEPEPVVVPVPRPTTELLFLDGVQ